MSKNVQVTFRVKIFDIGHSFIFLHPIVEVFLIQISIVLLQCNISLVYISLHSFCLGWPQIICLLFVSSIKYLLWYRNTKIIPLNYVTNTEPNKYDGDTNVCGSNKVDQVVFTHFTIVQDWRHHSTLKFNSSSEPWYNTPKKYQNPL